MLCGICIRRSASCAPILQDSPLPDQQSNAGQCRGHDGHKEKFRSKLRAAKIADRKIKRGERKWNDPAQKKLDGRAVDCDRVPSECDHVKKRRRKADAIFKPEIHAGYYYKDANANDSAPDPFAMLEYAEFFAEILNFYKAHRDIDD
jgi:hypothetical protein